MKYRALKFRSLAIAATAMIISVSSCNDELINMPRDEEERQLSEKLAELKQLTAKITCETSGEWKFVPIGAKGCGGPEGFLAYSVNADVNTILRKVEEYTELRKSFNSKYHVVSNCVVAPIPKSVRCQDGKPEFVY